MKCYANANSQNRQFSDDYKYTYYVKCVRIFSTLSKSKFEFLGVIILISLAFQCNLHRKARIVDNECEVGRRREESSNVTVETTADSSPLTDKRSLSNDVDENETTDQVCNDIVYRKG